ncbi:MAG TPA: alpha-amylase family glycosyl hydrolase [Bryobacteraceae bacterium]
MKALAALLLSLCLASAAAPSITKVEPPDWPAEAQSTTLRLLLTGANLTGALVEAPFPTSGVAVSASGTHLFLDLKLPAHPPPGDYSIRVGGAVAPFAIVAPLPASGRFQGFSPDDVIYLLMPDRFANGDPANDDPPISRGMHDRTKSRYYHGGDFRGIIDHLPYLKDLGVTAVWLTPVYDNVNHLNARERYGNEAITDYHGYGAVDFYAVEEHFGSLADFRDLVDRAHALGIKVILDQVANHTGPYHPWVKDPPTATWFHGGESQHLSNTWRTWTLIDPHATAAARRSTLDGWFAGILPDLNQDDPEVARYLIQNALWWIGRTGIDGSRQDTVPYVPRRFWHDWSAAIHARYPAFKIVGEVFDSDPALPSFFQGGRARFDGIDSGLDSVFDFPLQDAIARVFAGKAPLRELPKMLAHDDLYPDPADLVTFIGLHDMPRFLFRQGATPEALRQAFTFLLTARGIPMIYYGDEVGMTGGDDPDNRRDFPGGWKEDAANAFEASGRAKVQEDLVQAVRKLAHLRAATPALRRGAMIDLMVDDNAYAFARITADSHVLVVFNHAAGSARLHIPLDQSGIPSGARLQNLLETTPPVEVRQGALEIELPPHSAAVYR